MSESWRTCSQEAAVYGQQIAGIIEHRSNVEVRERKLTYNSAQHTNKLHITEKGRLLLQQ